MGLLVSIMATLLVVHSTPVTADQVRARMHEALIAREVIEQAKGVLAYVEQIDLGDAYDELLRRSRYAGTPLTQTALGVVRDRLRDHPLG